MEEQHLIYKTQRTNDPLKGIEGLVAKHTTWKNVLNASITAISNPMFDYDVSIIYMPVRVIVDVERK